MKTCINCGKEFQHKRVEQIYCSHPCYSKERSGKNNQNWKGGRYLSQWGYYYVRAPKEHPHKAANGYIFEHRLLMERSLGRYLEPTELVHHVNGIKTDNRLENLVVITKAAHNTVHFRGVKGKKRGRFPSQHSYKRDSISGRFI